MSDIFDDASGGAVVVLLLLLAGLVVLLTYLMMLAWNFLMPELFGLPTISFWQMFVLSFLTNTLTGGIIKTNSSK